MKRAESLILLAITLRSGALGQGIISTIAGADWVFRDNGQLALNASLGRIVGAATDKQGNIYVADQDNAMVFKIDASKVVTVFAGNGIAAYSGDEGLAINASLNFPTDVAVDSSGNVYIADNLNERIRKVDAKGIISTYAGNGVKPDADNPSKKFAENTAALQASMEPSGLAFDNQGILHFTDTIYQAIRKIGADGLVVTVAGKGGFGLGGDGGPANIALLAYPRNIAFDSAGNLYFTDAFNFRVRKVDRSGIITTIMGGDTRVLTPAPDGTLATASLLNIPFGIAIDKSGNIYVSDIGLHVVQVISADTGKITTVSGTGKPGFSGDAGSAKGAALNEPYSLWFDSNGRLLILDSANGRLRAIQNATISTVAGNGQYRASAENAPALQAFLWLPEGMAVDSAGVLYVADNKNNRIRKITPDGLISTVAGNGSLVFSGNDDGPVAQTVISAPSDVALDSAGNLYIAEEHSTRVRKLSANGNIITIAYGGFLEIRGPLVNPRALAVDKSGNVYVADGVSDTVRVIHLDGTINNFAGGGSSPCTGDGGPASSACLLNPSGVAVDGSGNVFIADTGHNLIRKVTSDNTITTIAGNGQAGYGGDGGPGLQAFLNAPQKIKLGQDGALYIADTGNHSVRVLSQSGTITTLAGTGAAGFAGDGGLATNALLNSPQGVVTDSQGNVYIADTQNNRVRVVSVAAPVFDPVQNGLSETEGISGGPPVVAATFPLSVKTDNRESTVPFTISSSASWLRANVKDGTTPATIEVIADPAQLSAGRFDANLTILVLGPAPATQTVSVRFIVAPSVPDSKISVDRAAVAVQLSQRTPVTTTYVQVRNEGTGSVPLSLITSSAPWLSATLTPNVAAPGAPAIVTISVDASKLVPGQYSATLTIQPANDQGAILVPITLTLAASRAALALTRTSLTFTAVAGGSAVLPSQTFSVLNTGSGTLQFSVSIAQLSFRTNQDWLSVTPTGGPLGVNGSRVQVSVKPSGLPALPPGKYYYGLLQVDATAPDNSASDNSPQFVSVVLNVVDASQDVAIAVTPATLVFSDQTGPTPGSQTVQMYNLGSKPIAYNVFGGTLDGGNWMRLQVPAPPLNPNQPGTVVVQTDASRLTPGVYRGALTFLFESGRVQNVGISLTVGPSRHTTGHTRAADGDCVPDNSAVRPFITVLGTGTRLTLGTGTQLLTGIPAVIDARVSDQNGCAFTTGHVIAEIKGSNKATLATVELSSLQDGTWEGRLMPPAPGPVTISVTAKSDDLGVMGVSDGVSAEIGEKPAGILELAGVLSKVSGLPGSVAPGSLISVVGKNMGPPDSADQSLPWTTQFGSVSAIIGGVPMAIAFISGTQINAVVPFGLKPGTSPQLVVTYDSGLSVQPLQVSVQPTQPAVSGLNPSGTQPRAGDTITVRCAGLGEVTPKFDLPIGTPVPTGALYNVVQPVTLTIGGQAANVISASLTPGLSGYYDVLAVVPSLGPGKYDMQVTAGSATSPIVPNDTITIR